MVGEAARFLIAFEGRTLEEWEEELRRLSPAVSSYLYYLEPEELDEVLRNRKEMIKFCEAALEGDIQTIYSCLRTFREWDDEGQLQMVSYPENEPDDWFVLRIPFEAGNRGHIIRQDFISCLLTKSNIKQAAKWLMGLEEEKDMVTIRQLVEASRRSEYVIRERIRKARERGQLQTWTKVGNTVLLERGEGMRLATEALKRGRPRKV